MGLVIFLSFLNDSNIQPELKKKWGWEEIQILNGVTLLTNCFFVYHLILPSRQLGMVRWAPVLQVGKRRLGVWVTCPESYS